MDALVDARRARASATSSRRRSAAPAASMRRSACVARASSNAGKLREFRRLLAPLGIDVVAQAELGIPEADEPHRDVRRECARQGAARERALRGLPALADDSGICVDALGGAPGVHIARATRASRVRRAQQREADRRAAGRRRPPRALLLRARARAPRRRSASRSSRRALARHDRRCAARRRRLRLRPAFRGSATGLTGAELPLERKNELSHRGKAMRA